MKFLRAFFCIFLLVFAADISAARSESAPGMDGTEGKKIYARPAMPESDRHVKIRLLPETTFVKPGSDIWIGIEQTIDPGWHTYWHNPGDTGAAPQFIWHLPPGYKIGEVHWPTPRKLPYDGFVNYGYDGTAIFLQKLNIPRVIMEGPIHLSVDVEILVCKEICIPEIGTYDLVLNDPAASAADNTAYLESTKGRLPAKSPSEALLRRDGDFVELRLTSYAWCEMTPQGCRDLDLFPHAWGIVDNTADAASEVQGDELVIRQKASFDRNWAELEKPEFLVAYHDASGQRIGIEFSARIDTTLSHTQALPGDVLENGYFFSSLLAFIKYFVLAILGGIVLNLMPCVFPVLSMKALSLVKTASIAPMLARLHGLAYAAGIILSFLVIAGVLIILQAAGAQIGWGFQLQNPVVVSLLIYLIFLIGLNLLGFFELGGGFLSKLGNLGSRYTHGEGMKASFFTGVLATLVATPCTAPFMGVAIGFALTQPPVAGLLIFAALGFGLALPYLVLSFIPAVQRKLPKPGTWMVTFKQFLAFPMFLTCAWLIWVLSQQAGSMGVVSVVLGMLALGFAIWALRAAPRRGGWRVAALTIAIVLVLTTIAFLPYKMAAFEGGASPALATSSESFGQKFSQTRLDALIQGNRAVFVEMTAAWCITCKVNHATSLNIPSTRALFAEKKIEYLIGDWTNYDPEITQYLERFDRNGVPLYVYYGPRDEGTGQRPEPRILPQILTPGIVAGSLK